MKLPIEPHLYFPTKTQGEKLNLGRWGLTPAVSSQSGGKSPGLIP